MNQTVITPTRRGCEQWPDLSQHFRSYVHYRCLMRFDAVPDFDHDELRWVILGLIECDRLTPLRGFDARHNREEKVAQGFDGFRFALSFADAIDAHFAPVFSHEFSLIIYPHNSPYSRRLHVLLSFYYKRNKTRYL